MSEAGRSRFERHLLSKSGPRVHLVLDRSLDIKELATEAAGIGLSVRSIDGSHIDSKQALFASIAEQFRFPDYFGHNWDALHECLADLWWLDTKSFVFLVQNAGALPRPELVILIEIAAQVAAEWRLDNVPFHSFLYGDGSLEDVARDVNLTVVVDNGGSNKPPLVYGEVICVHDVEGEERILRSRKPPN